MLANLCLGDGYDVVPERMVSSEEEKNVILSIMTQTTCYAKVYICHMYISIHVFCGNGANHNKNIRFKFV
jgi:hypothetical protein